MLKVLAPVRQSQSGSSFRRRRFDKHVVIVLGDIDRYQGSAPRRIVASVHGWGSSRMVGLVTATFAGVLIIGHDCFLMYYGTEFVSKAVDVWAYQYRIQLHPAGQAGGEQ